MEHRKHVYTRYDAFGTQTRPVSQLKTTDVIFRIASYFIFSHLKSPLSSSRLKTTNSSAGHFLFYKIAPRGDAFTECDWLVIVTRIY